MARLLSVGVVQGETADVGIEFGEPEVAVWAGGQAARPACRRDPAGSGTAPPEAGRARTAVATDPSLERDRRAVPDRDGELDHRTSRRPVHTSLTPTSMPSL